MGECKQDVSAGRASATPTELALIGTMLQRLKSGKDLREQKIQRLRCAIDSEEYENPLKLDVAAERVAEELISDCYR